MRNLTSHKRNRLAQVTLVSLRILALAFVFSLSGYSLYYAQSSSHFELRKIHYEGVVHVNQEALDRLIKQTFPKNILSVDLDRLRTLVESESWVKRARIRRRLPDRLLVYVIEREPAAVAAIDNELYLVDSEGIVLDRYGPRYRSLDKPIVKGLKNVARENAQQENTTRMAVYLQVLKELDSPLQDYSRSVSEIDVQDPERIVVIPADEPVPVFLGEDQFLKRYQTFVSKKKLYRQLKERYGTVESVDVSYDHKIIFHTPHGQGGAVVSDEGNETNHGTKEVASSGN